MVGQKHSWSTILEASWRSERLSMWFPRISTDLSGPGRSWPEPQHESRVGEIRRKKYVASRLSRVVNRVCECACLMRCSLENNAGRHEDFSLWPWNKQKSSTPSRRVPSVSIPHLPRLHQTHFLDERITLSNLRFDRIHERDLGRVTQDPVSQVYLEILARNRVAAAMRHVKTRGLKGRAW